MVTTIQVSEQLAQYLHSQKIYPKESYEDVIWDLVEDSLEISEETKKNIQQSEKEIAEGKTVKLEDIKKRLKL